MTFPLQNQLMGYSRALFSTWVYHKTLNILFDAGEGVSTGLLNRVFGIRRIFLSHGHADHIAGLTNLINIRNLGAGDQTADLKIYYPKDNKLVEFIKEYLDKTQKNLTFKLDWIPLEPGQVLELDDQRSRIFIKTFKTNHSPRQLSLGYNVVEIRRRLKPELASLTQKEINKIVWTQGKEAVADDYERITFSYCGDSTPIDPAEIYESMYLCHEATYIRSEDDERGFKQHSILADVFQNAKKARVSTLLLMHISLRYTLEELYQGIIRAAREVSADFKILILYNERLINASEVLAERMNRGEAGHG
jgi:ribonuclease Z